MLLADLIADLAVSPGPLGAALSVGTVAALPAMAAGGRVAERLGLRRVVVAAGGVLGLGMAGFAAVDGYGALVALLLLFFAASGVYDVGINAAAIGVERAVRRPVLPLLHAAFSGGGVLGALAAGVLVALGGDYRAGYLAVAGLVWALVALVAVHGLPEGGAPRGEQGGSRFGLFRERALLLVAAITACGFLLEGVMEEWSVIYLRSVLEVPALLGASGAATFHAAMLVGRLATSRLVRRAGRRAILRAAGVAAAGGMALALATEAVVPTLVGFLVVGLALAAVAPVAFSLAGDLAPDRVAAASAVLTTLGYVGFLIGPALVGGLAEWTGLRLALGAAGLGGLAIAALAGVGPAALTVSSTPAAGTAPLSRARERGGE